MRSFRGSKARRKGLSMFESLVAVTITTVAGGALLTSLSAAVQSSSGAMRVTVARGLADQLMDEIASIPFPLTSSTRSIAGTREVFDDIDDYNDWSGNSPVDRRGRQIGTEGYSGTGVEELRSQDMLPDMNFISRFSRTVVVERVIPDATNGWTTVTQHTNYRRVTVRVMFTDGRDKVMQLAEISRIFAYVPLSP